MSWVQDLLGLCNFQIKQKKIKKKFLFFVWMLRKRDGEEVDISTFFGFKMEKIWKDKVSCKFSIWRDEY